MGQIFNLDNPVWNFMSKVADLVILNILVMLCSLPVVTAGAAWTAMHFVTIRMARKEERYVVKDFFRSFKENFRQATVIWILALVAAGVFIGDVLIYKAIPDQIPKVLMIIVMVLAYLVLGTLLYAFPLLSRFYNTIVGTLKNAFLVSIVNIPYTFLFAFLAVLPFAVLYFVVELAPFVLLFGFSFPAYIAGKSWIKILSKFEPQQKGEKEVFGEDTEE